MKRLILNNLVVVAFAVSATLTSCGNERLMEMMYDENPVYGEMENTNDEDSYSGRDVYVTTYEFPNGGGSTDVKLWKNGVSKDVSGINYVTSVYATDDDVYIAGFGLWYAALWKNGEVQMLSNYQSAASSVFVSGDDVYVAGNEYQILTDGQGEPPIIVMYSRNKAVTLPDNRNCYMGYHLSTQTETGVKSSSEETLYTSVAKLWKNGEAQDLTDGTYDATAKSVYVSGEDVYVAGRECNEKNIPVAKLWKNGEAQDLTDGNHEAWANSVFVLGDDVYVAGWEYIAEEKRVAKLWKNGKVIYLTDGTRDGWANSVFVSGNDVYVVGTERNTFGWEVAKLWKNGVAQNLTSEYNDHNVSAEAHSVYVSDSDVFVSGFVWNGDSRGSTIATLLINGEAQNLTNGGGKHGYAYSVFVK